MTLWEKKNFSSFLATQKERRQDARTHHPTHTMGREDEVKKQLGMKKKKVKKAKLGVYSGAACPTSQYYTTPFSSYCSPPIKTKSSHAAA